ncbi:Toporsl [Phodopus roborovskii]|uniref:RING-type E3 ubiquitin transferase n=1 Tax=Phodopus roborovskii TaxID=109678 RepID=A0AAU9ZCL1_PHORO|nr:Toporsl [Phodopus roborovskii]
MALELSSNCECPNCLEGIQDESDRNSSSGKRGDGSLYSRSGKKSTLSPIMKRFLSQCCSIRLQNDNKDDSLFLPSEEESSMGFSQGQNLNEVSKNTKQKSKPLRQLTVQELLRKFGDGGKFPPYSRSWGNFKDHVVVEFRRALYYSGIWVKHVQGSGMEKQFSANYFKRNPSSLHRLIPWLKRELMVVYGDHGYTVKNILAAILHHMTQFNLDSESFTHLLEPYLLQHTHHFLHEFINFVHSSYNMETYDRSAIYQCPLSAWMKNKSMVSAPVLSLPEGLPLVISQQGSKQSKNTQVQQKTEPRPHSGLKQFSNGNYSSQNPQTSTTHLKTANKFHVWAEDEWGLDDFKDVVCTTNLLLDWDNLRESSPDTELYKSNDQEKRPEGSKLLSGHVQDLQKSRTSSHIHRESVDSNQVPPRKYNLRETNVFSPGPGHQVHYQNKEIEIKKIEESSSKLFQRLPREGTLIKSKSGETDHCSTCISRNVPFPTRNDKMLVSFRNKKGKGSQSSQCVEVGSHHSTRIQTQSSPRTPRPKSCCARFRTRSPCSDQSKVAMKGSHRSKRFTQRIGSGPSKGSVLSCASACRMASFTPAHHGKVCLIAGRRHSCNSKANYDSQTGRQCVMSSRRERVSRVKRIRTLEPPKPKCQCEDTQITTGFCVELGESP